MLTFILMLLVISGVATVAAVAMGLAVGALGLLAGLGSLLLPIMAIAFIVAMFKKGYQSSKKGQKAEPLEQVETEVVDDDFQSFYQNNNHSRYN